MIVTVGLSEGQRWKGVQWSTLLWSFSDLHVNILSTQALDHRMRLWFMLGNYLFTVATQYFTAYMHDLPLFYLYMQLTHTPAREWHNYCLSHTLTKAQWITGRTLTTRKKEGKKEEKKSGDAWLLKIRPTKAPTFVCLNYSCCVHLPASTEITNVSWYAKWCWTVWMRQLHRDQHVETCFSSKENTCVSRALQPVCQQ